MRGPLPVKHLSHLQGQKRVGVSSLISFVLKNANWLSNVTAPQLLSQQDISSRVASTLLFSLQHLYFDQWPLQTVCFGSPEDISSWGNWGRTTATLSLLTPGNWLLLDLQPQSFGLRSFCLVLVFWVYLSLDKANVGLWPDQFWPDPPVSGLILSVSVLLDLILGIIVPSKLCAQNSGGPIVSCQKHRIFRPLGIVGKKCWEYGGSVHFDLV